MESHSIPYAIRLLQKFCPPHLLEEIEGDLLERFERDSRLMGERKAKRRLLWNVIRYFRPGILLRNRFSANPGPLFMMIANFRFTIRHLLKHKSNSFIHLTGLTMGITVCLLIALYIAHQVRFDSHHQNAERIYRVNSVFREGEINFNLYATPGLLSQNIQNNVTGVQHVTKARAFFKTIIVVEPQKLFKQDHLLMVDSSFFDVFDTKPVLGNVRKALQRPYQAVLSQSTANKYFGSKDPLGKVIKLKNKYSFTVAGIMEDSPSNTSLPADILLSFTDAPDLIDNGDTWFFGDFEWVKLQMSTFILLKNTMDVASVQTQLATIANKQVNANPHLSEKIQASFQLQPLKDIHFDTQRFGGGPWVPAVSTSWLLFFAGIGAIVLVLACVNFLNLSTAKAATRAKEVGIRKSIGAIKRQLVFQFLTEAFLLVFVAVLLSLVITRLLLNPINDLIGETISFQSILSARGMSIILGGVMMIVLLAGIYPAWFIARFSPVTTLKIDLLSASYRTGGVLRRSLVAIQFIISSVLIIAVLVISRQVDFMHTKNLGFEKENIITVELPDVKKAESVKAELLRLTGVTDASVSRSSPISTDHWWNSISLNEDSDKRFSVCAIYGDERFYSFYGLRLLSGRIPMADEFIPDSLRRKEDVYKVVVNENLLKTLALGQPEEAIGKHFWWGSAAEISGVVADFNTEPLEYEITPTIITQHPGLFSQANIKLANGNGLVESIASVEKVWKKNFPAAVFEVKFLDQQIHDFYHMENRVYQLFKLFAIVAICISCLGLWGLVTFMAHIRVKEIGIRKVFGATVKSIVLLFSRDFFVTVAISFLIACPFAYLLLSELLTRVAYRVTIGWDVFVLAGAVLMALVIITVSIQAIRSANLNPVNSLKNE